MFVNGSFDKYWENKLGLIIYRSLINNNIPYKNIF